MINSAENEKGVCFLSKSYQNLNFNLERFRKELNELEKLFIKDKINNETEFRKWQNDFKLIYGAKHTDIQLYITLALLYFIGHCFILKYVLKNDTKIINDNDFLLKIKKIKDRMKNELYHFNVSSFEYFDPILKKLNERNLRFFISAFNKLVNHVFELEIEPVYKFDFLMQNIISPSVRHKSGEFYTMPFLVRKMVEEKYEFGEKVIDPCCGSGNFLIEIIKKIMSTNKSEEQKILAINNLYGYDINPISIFITKINFLILLSRKFSNINLNLYVVDSLFPHQFGFENYDLFEKNFNTFDLIIGNPPWYTFRDIDSIEYQNQIKILAENLGIKPLPKNILNIEISALFFYQAKELYSKNNGKIFFVITKGVITGSHAARFRNFNGFKNMKIWTFDKKIEKIFNIDFICLFAQRTGKDLSKLDLEIPVNHYSIKNEGNNIKYFSPVELELESKSILVPYAVEIKAKKKFTKKLIPKELKEELLPNIKSYYKTLFHKGADLNPRNLIFLTIKDVNNDLVMINPDERIFKKAKIPWDKTEFSNELLEKKYIFKVVKSTELVKFHIFDYYSVFLPLSNIDLRFDYEGLDKYARLFYDKINDIYLKNKKSTTKHNSLMDNLNRWGKLINKRQLSKIKVVYNNSGSILNAAVVQGDILTTGDLSFYDTNNLDEAYYLSSILNSNLMTHQIKIRKSSRHIFKIPFEIPIKKYNLNNQNHKKLAELAKICQNIANNTINGILKSETKIISKIKIQKILNNKLYPYLTEIDKLLLFEFH